MTPETICNRCVSLVGLPDVVILDVEDVPGAALRVHVELTRSPQGCPTCVTLAAALITASTGELPIHQADAWVWMDVKKAPQPVLPSGAQFFRCTKGEPSRGVPAVQAASSCVLDKVDG